MSELCSVPRVSERFAQSNALDEDIARLKYVSGKREEALRRLGIRTVGDLLLHIPHRYLDFTRSWSIEMAPIGTVCTIIAGGRDGRVAGRLFPPALDCPAA